MLTSAQAEDVVNLVASGAVASLQADAWLGTSGTGGIGSIGRGDADTQTYAAHELPALAVAATLENPEDDVPEGVRGLHVGLIVTVFDASGDRSAVRERVREVCSQIARWMVDQQDADGNSLGGVLTAGEGTISPGDTETTEAVKGGTWRHKAVVSAEILLYGAA